MHEAAGETEGSPTEAADEFGTLEHKVLQTVELIRKEREARAAAEEETSAAQAEVVILRDRIAVQQETAAAQERALDLLYRERAAMRLRVESMLQRMDELL